MSKEKQKIKLKEKEKGRNSCWASSTLAAHFSSLLRGPLLPSLRSHSSSPLRAVYLPVGPVPQVLA
jgi:hypothetical protein